MTIQDEKATYTDDVMRRELQDLVHARWLSQVALDHFDELVESWAAANALLDAYDEHGLRAFANPSKLIAAAELLRLKLGRGE